MCGRSAGLFFMVVGMLLPAGCTTLPDDAARGSSLLPNNFVAPPPADMAGSGMALPTKGPITERIFHGRPVRVIPISSTVFGDPTYTLQIMGDHLMMGAGCPLAQGNYSFRGNIILVCGGLYRIEITAVANHYIVNGVAIELSSGGGNMRYGLLPSGGYTTETG